MKKLCAVMIALMMMYVGSVGHPARVVDQIYEGNATSNDLYIVAFGGWYMPLIADDLIPDDVVQYNGITSATYLYHYEIYR